MRADSFLLKAMSESSMERLSSAPMPLFPKEATRGLSRSSYVRSRPPCSSRSNPSLPIRKCFPNTVAPLLLHRRDLSCGRKAFICPGSSPHTRSNMGRFCCFCTPVRQPKGTRIHCCVAEFGWMEECRRRGKKEEGEVSIREGPDGCRGYYALVVFRGRSL
ncbi:hypothetical protein CPB85DRAFT_1308919, partial [Mucidula mucida]